MLLGHHLRQRPVGRVLARDRACAHALELAVDAEGAAGIRVGGDRVELAQHPLVGDRPLDRPLERRLEPGHRGERRPLARRDLLDQAVDVGAVEAAVERDHLAVERVQGPEPEVAVLGELGEGDVAVEGALEQGADRRGLEQHVRIVLGMEVAVAKRLDVQMAGEALVEHQAPAASAGAATAAAASGRSRAPFSTRRGSPRSGNGISTRSKSRGANARSNACWASASTARTS